MLPMPLEVGLHSYAPDEERDRYNVRVPAYAPAKDAPGIRLKVYGWAVRSSNEPPESGPSPHNMVVTEVDLFAPPAFPVGPYDLVDLPDGQYEVIGEPQSFHTGPFGAALGVLVKLRKAIL